MHDILLILFWSTIFLCLCTYACYPLVIWILSSIFSMRVKEGEYLPTLSIIISAYNEGRHIEEKIRNTFSQDYPKERMEILVGSDGSADETMEILGKFSDQGVSAIEFKINRGKTAVQNDLVKMATGEILVFTDAASFLREDAIKKLVSPFLDERIGCVGGRMHFVGTDRNMTTQSQGLYWRYESRIREMESNLGRLIGVDGPLYAVRRACYVSLKLNIISDLVVPLIVLSTGKRVVLEKEALVYEEPTTRFHTEMSTRRRITVRGLVSLFIYRKLLNPFVHPLLAAQIFFHKILRWFVGPLVVLNCAACLALSGNKFFGGILVCYGVFFAAAAIGWAFDYYGKTNRFFTVPYYFMLVNLAATLGVADFFRKREVVKWETVRN